MERPWWGWRVGLALVMTTTLVQVQAAGPRTSLQPLLLVPAPRSSEVPLAGLISVIFDRPVVPLARLGVGPSAATITPALPGQGRWLGTATWTLIPTHGLAPATTYTVRLNPALRAIDGSSLSAPTVWQFSTLRPAVAAIAPQDSADSVLPGRAIVVTFNLPVVHSSAQAHFSLSVAGVPLPGRFSWRDARTMRFTPLHLLPRGARVQVREAPGVAALGGPLPGVSAARSSFTVAPTFVLASSEPAGGATAADPATQIALHFSAPIDLRAAGRYLRISPAIGGQQIQGGDLNTLIVYGSLRPSTTYRITLLAGLPDLIGDRLAAPRTLSFTTAPYQSAVTLIGAGSLNTYDAYRGVGVIAAATNVSRLTLSVYRQSAAEFLRTSDPNFDRGHYTAAGLPLVVAYSRVVTAPLNHTVSITQRITRADGTPLPPGYYAVFVSAPGMTVTPYLPLLVTRSALTLKWGDTSVLVWGTDLRSGAALGGLPVRVTDAQGHTIVRGRSGPDGVFSAALPPGQHLIYRTLRAFLERPGDVAAAGSEWTSGITPYDFKLTGDQTLAHVRLSMTTDRPIYRPGQVVYLRGIARADDDGRYRPLAPGSAVHLVATDGLGHTILTTTLHLNTQGVFDGQLLLSAGAVLGGYTLGATVSNETSYASFTVAAYKKPTFQVALRPDRGESANYIQGEQIGATTRASYYFGAPLAQAPVQWNVSSAATTFQPGGYDGYSFTDSDLLDALYQKPDNQQVTQLSGRTDATGSATVHLPADLQGSPLPHLVTIEANITSPTQQQVAQQSTVIVHPAGVYVGLRPLTYLAAPRAAQALDLVTVHPDGSPVAHSVVVVTLQRRTIYSVLTDDPQLGYLWQTHNRDTTLATFRATTDSRGHAVIHVAPPDEGEFRVTASASDGAGHTARTAAYLYSMAPGSADTINWGQANNDRIALIADRAQYTVGQTAHILIAAPQRDMTALVTIERGTVLSHQVLPLHGNGAVLALPITRALLPNAYISVVLVKGSGADPRALPLWKIGYTTLVVNPLEHALSVQVVMPHGPVRPGSHVQVHIHTSDGHGRPVSADLGVSLVDAAVLALATDQNGTPSDTFYAQRPLGIATASSMVLFIDRLNLTPHNGAKGGGGASASGATAVRTRFPDTAYWSPNVVTDLGGNATLEIALPDNLTTWHLTADGSTVAGTLLGRGGSDLVVNKPVLLEPALPRFLTVRDTSSLGAVVSNITGSAVRLSVAGTVSEAHSPATTLPGQIVVVPAHGDRAVYWPYTAQMEGPLAVTLTALAATPDRSDALAVTLPVESNSLVGAEAAATAGDTSANLAIETVRLPGAIEPGEGDLRLTLEPSLVAGLAPAGDYLLAYSYLNVEATTSRLTGLLALASLPGRRFGLSATAQRALPGLITTSAAQLYAMQGNDGGWGWWSGDPSDPFISAYAYEGLTFLHENGYAVDSSVLGNALSYLQGRLTAPPSDPYRPDDATRAFILYALDRAGHSDPAAIANLYERRHSAALSPAALAELAAAISGAFGPQDPRLHTLIAELDARAHLTSIAAHWDAGAIPSWSTMESSSGDTAEVIRMLVRFAPHDPLLPRAVRWLMAQRGGGASQGAAGGEAPGYYTYADAPDGAWQSTEATALALRALAFYALHSNDLHPAYRYRVLVNGSMVTQGTVSPSDAGQPRQVAVALARLRTVGSINVVRIERTALPGGLSLARTPLHYTVRLRYYPVPGSVGAADSGISITRRYLTHGGAAVGGSAPSGATLTVELRLVAPQDLSRVLIEDPLPAGAEAVDGTLLTSSVFAQPGGGPDGSGTPFAYQPSPPGQPQDLSLYVDHTELRDDRTALFVYALPAGTYIYRYTIHLTTPGLYHVLPAHAAQLYEPEVFGHTGEGSLQVR